MHCIAATWHSLLTNHEVKKLDMIFTPVNDRQLVLFICVVDTPAKENVVHFGRLVHVDVLFCALCCSLIFKVHLDVDIEQTWR